jgi:hypothetical protein
MISYIWNELFYAVMISLLFCISFDGNQLLLVPQLTFELSGVMINIYGWFLYITG